MGLLHRPLRATGAAVLGLAAIALTGAFAGAQASTVASPSSSAPSAVTPLVALRDSLPATTDRPTGAFTAARMSVEVSLAPRDETGLNAELKAALHQGQRPVRPLPRQGPVRRQVRADDRHPGRGRRLPARRGPGGFVYQLAVPAPRHRLEREDHGRLPHRPPQLRRPEGRPLLLQLRLGPPARLRSPPPSRASPACRTPCACTRARSGRPPARRRPARRPRRSPTSSASCETGYVTTAELFDFVSDNTGFPYGYGGGPGCSGLTPSQTNSMYGAPRSSPRTQGRRRHRRGLRALRLPGVRHRHLGAVLLRPALQPAAGQRHRGRRPAGPGLPGRRHLPGQLQRLLERRRGRRRHRDARWRSRPTSGT